MKAHLPTKWKAGQPKIPWGVRWSASRCLAIATLTAALLLPQAAPTTLNAELFSPENHRLERLANAVAAKATRLNRQDQWVLALNIDDLGRKFRIDPYLILAIVEVESNFDPHAVSSVGALGLMQVRPFVGEAVAKQTRHSWQSPSDLFEIDDNLFIGTAYFAKLLGQFDLDLDLALTAYNHGPSRLNEILSTGTPVPMKYAQKVRQAYAHWLRSI